MAGDPPENAYPSTVVGRSDGASLRFTYTPEDIHIQRRNGLDEVLYERQIDYTEATEHLRPKAVPPNPQAQPERQAHPGTEGNGNTLGRCVAPVPPSQVAACEANPEVEDETPAEVNAKGFSGGSTGGAAQMPAAPPPTEMPGSSSLRPPAPSSHARLPPEMIGKPTGNSSPFNITTTSGGVRGAVGRGARNRGGALGAIGGLIFGGAGAVGFVTHRWSDNGIDYEVSQPPEGINTRGIRITHPDGTQEHYQFDPSDGTFYEPVHGGDPVATLGPETDGAYPINPISEQDRLGYKTWQANGGEGSYQEWVAEGKPESPEDSAQGKDGGKVLEKKNPYLFENQLPEHLDAELTRAEELGVKPVSPSDAEFDELINEGGVKYVVTEDGQLLVGPYSVEGEEISHAVLSNGEPVLSAGHADIAGSAGSGYWGADLSTHSGHFLNGATGVENAAARLVAEDAFAGYGIHFPPPR